MGNIYSLIGNLYSHFNPLDYRIYIFTRFLFTGFVLLGVSNIPPTLASEHRTDSRLSSRLFERVADQARELARQKYVPPEAVTAPYTDLNYQQYRSIQFRPDTAIWKGKSLFEIQLFHPGFLFNEPITIHTVDSDGLEKTVPFDPAYFQYDQPLPVDNAPPPPGYSGFRVHYPLNMESYKDEAVVFQGASYFRLLGSGQTYGLSARGLAIDTALPTGEEFPSFRAFWLVEPDPATSQLFIVALLDSPSMTGTYLFELSPGISTEMVVTAKLFARKAVTKVGLAPLTSMFYHGENSIGKIDDYRPEVHDSDGLLILTSKHEWIWRPLTNPAALRVSSFLDENPRGFGLVQRDSDFDNYLDTEKLYSQRPSLWVEPDGNWGKGHIELVEIPTASEINDNVVAYWVPSQPFKSGETRQFRYKLRTFNSHLPQQERARVVRTRIGWAGTPDQDNPPPRARRQFILDFGGGDMDKLSNQLKLDANLQLSSGEASDVTVTRLPDNNYWRLTFKLMPKDEEPIDMRAYISWQGQQLTEIWNYVWYPKDLH